MNCPKCDADIRESYEPDDPSVGICGGWYCDACDLAIAEHEVAREPMDDDVSIMTANGERSLGTPISELSGQPGDPNNPSAGYAEFCRIARSWGHD